MTHTYIGRLFEHVFWADRRVLELLRAAPDPERLHEATRLFAHVVAAERVWLLRLRGEDSAVQPIWPELTLTEIADLSAANEEEYTRYLREQPASELEREIEYRNSAGTPFRTRADDILTHVALHGSYHRGQVARAVRAAGEEPVNTDYITFVREMGWGS